MKNREITKDEINKITERCRQPREKAFFTFMRQSGLPPHIIKQLKIMNVEEILDSNTPIPCKIDTPHTFIGEETVRYLKEYFLTRKNLTQESLLFTPRNNPNREINTKDVSRAFKLTAQGLHKERKINYEIKKGKPSELTLFSLIDFYRKHAKYYLSELKNSPLKDDEFYRKLYEKAAMPFLEIETPTPIQIHQLKKKNIELEEELNMISESITNRVIPIVDLFDSIEGLEEFLKQFKTKQTKAIAKNEKKLTEELKKAGRKRDRIINRKLKFYTSGLKEPTKEDEGKFQQALKEKELKEQKQNTQ